MAYVKKIDGVWHKQCSKCGEIKPKTAFEKHRTAQLKVGTRCHDCLRKQVQCKRSRHPIKDVSRTIYRGAVQSGKIVLKRCAVTNCRHALPIEGHHFDYSKPLSVIPLCEYHHKELHANSWQLSRAEGRNYDAYAPIDKLGEVIERK